MASQSSPPLSTAPWLELFDSGHGLGLSVTRDAPAGTALLMERPLAAVTSIRSRDSRDSRPPRRRRCRRCLSLLSLRAPSRVRACGGGCGASSFYCDSDCEEEDRDAHVSSGECELLRRAGEKKEKEQEDKDKEAPPLLREACLALRLLRARPPSAGPLVTHSEELLSGERAGQVRAAAELAARALEAAVIGGGTTGASRGGDGGGGDSGPAAPCPSPPPLSLPFEAFRCAASAALCAAIANSLELRFCDEDGGEGDPNLPLAVFAFAARANHSCRPSASFSTRSKGRVSLRALRDLSKGEEVTICYLSGGGAELLPLAARRRALKRDRCFLCECKRCLLEESLGEEGEEERGGGEVSEEASGGNSRGSAAGAAAAATTASAARAAAAVLSSLGPCLSAERLLARGETAAIEVGGKAWAAAARALVEAAGEALRGGGEEGGGRRGGGQRSSERNASTAAGAAATRTTTAAPPSFAGPPPHSDLFPSVRAAAEACLDAPLEGAFSPSLLRLLRDIPGTTTAATTEGEDEKKGLEAVLRGAAMQGDFDVNSALPLARAAAHASARAAALLGAALGRAHPAAERARFLAFGGGGGGGGRENGGGGSGGGDGERGAASSSAAPALPFCVAAQVVRLAASLEKAAEGDRGKTVN